jgi:preprotein translocase subunit SecE
MSETNQTPEKRTVLMVIAWVWVLGPFAYGLDQLIVKVAKLFNS